MSRTKIDVPWPRPSGENKHYQSDGPEDAVEFEHQGVRFRVSPTKHFGVHTGRPRFMARCLTCDEVLHKRTTGPANYCESHFDSVHRSAQAPPRTSLFATQAEHPHHQLPSPSSLASDETYRSLGGSELAAALRFCDQHADHGPKVITMPELIDSIGASNPPPAVRLCKDGEASVQLINYPAGVYLEYRDASGRMIYSERFDNVIKIANRLAEGKIGTPS